MCVGWGGSTRTEEKGINVFCLKGKTEGNQLHNFSKNSYLSTCSFLLVELLA